MVWPLILLPIIFIGAMYVAIKIDVQYKENRRKRVLKSMYDFWDENTDPLG
jgi:hypothetical protein